MSHSGMRNALNEYKKVGVHGGIESASPHRLIQMLMEGALDKISAAKGFMERGDVAKKGEFISWAISIIDGLRVSLDKNLDNEIVNNLDALYDYMNRTLMEANINNDTAKLDEVARLMHDIKTGWDGIESEAQQLAVSQQAKARIGI